MYETHHYHWEADRSRYWRNSIRLVVVCVHYRKHAHIHLVHPLQEVGNYYEGAGGLDRSGFEVDRHSNRVKEDCNCLVMGPLMKENCMNSCVNVWLYT